MGKGSVIHTLSGHQIRDLFVNGEKTATEICTHFLDRISLYDAKIGAFTEVFYKRALTTAKQLDEKKAHGKSLGKLAAIPVAVKDNIHVKGELTTCGSRFLQNYRAPFNSTATRLLEEEDAILIGKTNLDEFAMGSFTENSFIKKTYNPWNIDFSPGGSSGGSAAAVAARLCPAALGSDTGGSIRQPASYCGVIGFKPTYGRVSRYGLVALGSSLDQIGPLTTNVEDAALIMEVLGRHCEKDSTSLPIKPFDYFGQPYEKVKIGIPWQFLEGIGEEPKAHFIQSLTNLQQLGNEIIDVDLCILKYAVAAYTIIASAEASTNLARFDGIKYGARSTCAETLGQLYLNSRQEGFGPEVKRRILLGTYVLSAGNLEAYYRKAQKVRALIIRQFKNVFSACDLVAIPTAPTTASKVGEIKDSLKMYLADVYTTAANLAGLPAVSIPNGFSTKGLPYGLQLIGPPMKDVCVLKTAEALQHTTSLHFQIPNAFRG